ncbi:hypothetical protein ABT269_36165 [Streptomyces viridosporus]|uniref:hypothetical protein n=2 Tax=Streptomyces TaxID=1883 RepID=UPI00332ACD0E
MTVWSKSQKITREVRMRAEGMAQRAKDMADKLRHKGEGGKSGKARHKTQGRNKLLEAQMKKLQERRHRHR